MIPAERAHLHVAAVSDPGISGKKNEDRLRVTAFSTPQDPPLPSLLAIIADGIGGHRAGEIAAEIAIETIGKVVAASDASQPVFILHEAIQQISTDHTWVQEAIDGGMLSLSQARRHPNAHVIRRYLGSRQPAIPDLRLKLNNLENDRQAETNQGLALKPEDRILLCSDGLTDLVEDHEILDYLQSHPLERALQQLVLLSNQRGGHDNITIIGLQNPKPAGRPSEVPIGSPRKRKWAPACAVFTGIMVIAALLVGSLAFGIWKLNAVKTTSTPAGLSSPFPSALPAGGINPTRPPTGTQALHPSSSPAQTRQIEATPQSATLTPWPTNTRQP